MLNLSNKLKRLACCLTLIVLPCVLGSGCAAWAPQGDGFPEWQQSAFLKSRPDTPGEAAFATSAKGREIEQSFGIGR